MVIRMFTVVKKAKWELKQKSVKMKVTRLCSTLCDPMDYTVHGIPWARMLE